MHTLTHKPNLGAKKHSATYQMPLFCEVVLCLNQQQQ